MASADTVVLNDPHPPKENALHAFKAVLSHIKAEIIRSRHHWNKHQPEMWSRAADISDANLVNFELEHDLIQVRSGTTGYGTVIFGKIRIPAIHDAKGEGFVHVRIHDPPNRGAEDVVFHSILTDEVHVGDKVEWCAVQTADKPLEFFNE